MWLSERALYLRELIPYCFILFASEYKESEEREDKNNEEEHVGQKWSGRHTLDGDYIVAAVSTTFVQFFH